MEKNVPASAAEQSVTSILLEVIPGDDGMGQEVYATSVEDVKRHMAVLAEELEEWELGIRRLPASAPVAGEAQKPIAVVKENPYCPEGMSDEISEYLPNGTELYAAPQASEAVAAEALEVAREALMEIADLADVDADDRSVIVNRALTKIDRITALSAQPGAQKKGGRDAN